MPHASAYSYSSAVVFELIKSGKCVYELPMMKGLSDHYGLTDKLLVSSDDDSPEMLCSQREQLGLL